MTTFIIEFTSGQGTTYRSQVDVPGDEMTKEVMTDIETFLTEKSTSKLPMKIIGWKRVNPDDGPVL